jgi:SAM-dependent methyltransferase
MSIDRQRFRHAVARVIGDPALDRILGVKNRYKFQLKTREAFPASLLPKPSLNDLGKIYGSDKHDAAHTFDRLTYLDVYAKYLEELRDRPVSMLELGVRDGKSLLMWERYFPQGRIYGIDIDPRCSEFAGDRKEVAIGSQGDVEFLKSVFGGRQFDVILDDASHVNTLSRISFENLFDRVVPGGLYIIEDLGCSYLKLDSQLQVRSTWPGMKYNAPDVPLDNDRKVLDEVFLELLARLDHRQGDVRFVHFWSQLVVIGKAVESK